MRIRLWLLGTELFDLVLGELPNTEHAKDGATVVDGTHHHIGFQTRGLDTEMPEER